MKFENTQVWGFEHALRGMRNPKNSWHLSDTVFSDNHNDFVIGPKDMKLALALTNAGPEHRKFLRQIMISVDITAPLYWWKEFDTYKVATVANSTSTMHKIQSYPITRESFEMDDFVSGLKFPVRTCNPNLQIEGELFYDHEDFIDNLIKYLENLRLEYNSIIEALKLPHGDPEEIKALQEYANTVWKELIRWLPESWLQTRTVTMNYETARAMCSPGQRRFHKLNEWSGIHTKVKECFISWARTLPYAEQFIFTDEMPKPEKRLIDKIVDALAILGVKAKDEKGNFRLFAYIMDDVAKVYSEAMKEQN